MQIWGHSLVCNEDKYLWYSIKSVIDYLDKMLLWDTGSTDNTRKIIDSLTKEYPEKIIFKEVGNVTPDSFTDIRSQMLAQTKGDWMIIVDGDEVWWENSIKTLTDKIRSEGGKLDTIVNPYYNLIGDIFHHQPEEAGKYKIDERVGNITIRAINMHIPGLKVQNPHGTQGFYDGNNTLIQNLDSQRRIYLDTPYLHFTHMHRSTNIENFVPKRKMKYKHELGIEFPKDFYYPEAFFNSKPDFVASPWNTVTREYTINSYIQTPFRRLKRKINSKKIGY